MPDLDHVVLHAIRTADPALSWDELIERIEDECEDSLDRLRDEGRVAYDGRQGGYVLAEE